MKNLLLLFLSLTLIAGCSLFSDDRDDDTEETPVVLVPIPFLKDTLDMDNHEYCFIETPLIYEDKLILMITNNESREGWINCYDKLTLELLWTWREALDEIGLPAVGFGSISYIHDDILAIAQSNLSYGIDVNTGQTLWKNREGGTAFSAVLGLEETITNIHTQETYNHSYIKVANLRDGKWRNVYDYIKDDDLRVLLRSALPFLWEGTEYLAFISGKWSAAPPLEIYWLNLFNLTENKLEWTSDTIPLYHPLSGTPGNLPQFEDGQILLANDAIYSYNVEDGSLEWWERYTNRFVLTSHLKVADGKVFGNNEDHFFVGLDVQTGEELFNTPSGGTASKIAHHDGKCYMAEVTSGGISWLMVIDCVTGDVLHKVAAPFTEDDRQWVYERAIAVDPETGLVYTADHRYLLVYDFEE